MRYFNINHLNYFIMRKLLLFLLLILSFNFASAQDNLTVECGVSQVPKDLKISIDNLIVDCSKSLLLQDNAVLTIKGEVIGEGLRMLYSDVGDTIHTLDEQVKMNRTDIDGNPYIDYRMPNDVNPLVVFEKCMPYGIYVGEHVDVQYSSLCEETLGDGEVLGSIEDEMLLDCIIYNFSGQKLYEGKFSGIFNGGCGVKCLSEDYWNLLLLIQFQLDGGRKVNSKRIYVR